MVLNEYKETKSWLIFFTKLSKSYNPLLYQSSLPPPPSSLHLTEPHTSTVKTNTQNEPKNGTQVQDGTSGYNREARTHFFLELSGNYIRMVG